MKTSYNHESLNRHGITEQEVDDVYATGIDFDLSPAPSGSERIMLVGWTSTGRLLEVGIEYLSNGDENIFHASDATTQYRQLFEKNTK